MNLTASPFQTQSPIFFTFLLFFLLVKWVKKLATVFEMVTLSFISFSAHTRYQGCTIWQRWLGLPNIFGLVLDVCLCCDNSSNCWRRSPKNYTKRTRFKWIENSPIRGYQWPLKLHKDWSMNNRSRYNSN